MLLIQIDFDVEWTIKLFQHRMLRILLCEIGMLCRNLPINTKAIIKDRNTSISLWMIELIALVLENCGF